MKYRKLDGLNKEVSALSLGSYRTFESIEFDEVVSILGEAFQQGVNLLDCARYRYEQNLPTHVPFGTPSLQVIVGRALKEVGAARDSYIYADKLWWDKVGKRSMRQEVAKSLELLEMDYIDVLYLDRLSAHPMLETRGTEAIVAELMSEVADLIDEGLVKSWGVINWQRHELECAISPSLATAAPKPILNELKYNIAYRGIVGEDWFEKLSRESGLRVTATIAMEGGILTGKYANVGSTEETRRMALENLNDRQRHAHEVSPAVVDFAAAAGVKPSAVALAWCLLNPLVATVTFGVRSVAQLRQNLKAEAVLAEHEEQLRAAFLTAGWSMSDIAKSTVA